MIYTLLYQLHETREELKNMQTKHNQCVEIPGLKTLQKSLKSYSASDNKIANSFVELADHISDNLANRTTNVQTFIKKVKKSIINSNNPILQGVVASIKKHCFNDINQHNKKTRNPDQTCIVWRRNGFSRRNIENIRREV